MPQLALWLRASEGVEADGQGYVGAWRDQSGHGRDALASGTQKPQVGYDGQGVLGLRFDGTNDFMSVASSANMLGSVTGFTLVMKVNMDTDGQDFQALMSDYDGQAWRAVSAGHRSGGHWAVGDCVLDTGVAAPRGSAVTVTYRSSSGNVRIYVNGSLVWAKGSGWQSCSTPANGIQSPAWAWVLGRQGVFDGGYFKGWIREIQAYDRDLSDSERATVEACQPLVTATVTPTVSPTPAGGGQAARAHPDPKGKGGLVLPFGVSAVAVPNPASGRTLLVFEGGDASRAEVSIFNILGDQVLRLEGGPGDQNSGVFSVPVDLGGLANGVYVAVIRFPESGRPALRLKVAVAR